MYQHRKVTHVISYFYVYHKNYCRTKFYLLTQKHMNIQKTLDDWKLGMCTAQGKNKLLNWFSAIFFSLLNSKIINQLSVLVKASVSITIVNYNSFESFGSIEY